MSEDILVRFRIKGKMSEQWELQSEGPDINDEQNDVFVCVWMDIHVVRYNV